MKPIYLKPDQSVVFVAMKDEPTIFPFGPIAELIAVGKRPFIVGEICYVPETYDCRYNAWGVEEVAYKADGDACFLYWRSPATMPAELARCHVRIVSCEPIQQDGKWKWRVEVRPLPDEGR